MTLLIVLAFLLSIHLQLSLIMKTNTSYNNSSVVVKGNVFGFQALSDVVLSRRSKHTNPADPDSEAPRVILIFGFYGAPIHTLWRDYVRRYVEKWPSASIIVIRSVASWFICSQNEKDSLLMPAIEILLEEVYEPSNYNSRLNGLLIHIMSNGGGFMFTFFMNILERSLVSRKRNRESWRKTKIAAHEIQRDIFEPLAMILDSCPGSGGIKRRGSPFVTSFKSPILKSVALVPATIAFSALLGALYVCGAPQPFSTMHARLMRNDIVPGLSDYSTPRLYIYSEGDEVVDYREVEAHLQHLREAADADQQRRSFRGFIGVSDPISVEKFSLDSPHVLHVRTDAKRYWAAVDRLWEEALRTSAVIASVRSRAKL